MKRIFLFFLTNILVMISISVVYNLLAAAGFVPQGYMGQMLVFSVLIGFGGSFISLLISKWMAKRMMGVQIIDENGPYSGLVHRVHDMAQRAGLKKMPEVGIYDSPEVNAFATGPSKNNALVAVSSGLLQKMDDEEVRGVLAHEISHVANGDMVTMALVQGVVNSFTYLVSFLVTNIITSALRGNSERGIGDNWFVRQFIFSAVYGLVAFAAFPIVAGFSRYREYRADKGGATLAGKQVMISALEKLKGSVDTVQKSEAAFQSMKISSKSSFAEFFSTHPTLDKRIRALESL